MIGGHEDFSGAREFGREPAPEYRPVKGAGYDIMVLVHLRSNENHEQGTICKPEDDVCGRQTLKRRSRLLRGKRKSCLRQGEAPDSGKQDLRRAFEIALTTLYYIAVPMLMTGALMRSTVYSILEYLSLAPCLTPSAHVE